MKFKNTTTFLFKFTLFCLILSSVVFVRSYFVKHLPVFTFTDTATYELPAMEKLNKLEPSMPVRTPVYPALITTIYTLLDKQSRNTVIIFQHILGVLHFLLLFYIATCIFRNYLLSLCSALFISVYHGYLFYEHCLLSDFLGIFLFTTTAALLCRYIKRKTPISVIITGVVFSLLILTRPVYMFSGLAIPPVICLVHNKHWLKNIFLFSLPVVVIYSIYTWSTYTRYGYICAHTSIHKGLSLSQFLVSLPEIQELKEKYSSHDSIWHYELLLNIDQGIDAKTEKKYRLAGKRSQTFYGAKQISTGNFNILDILGETKADLAKNNRKILDICISVIRKYPTRYLNLVLNNIKNYMFLDMQTELQDIRPLTQSTDQLIRIYQNKTYRTLYNPSIHIWLFLAGILMFVINCIKKDPSIKYTLPLLLLFFFYLIPITMAVIPVYRYVLAVIWIEYLFAFYIIFSVFNLVFRRLHRIAPAS